ncbi:MAG TPA: hypothetical protein VFQ38_05980 [Longimicrobiales bacterium]|nr:hypothetical protein [Longimicrobiales bacterium]
MVRFTVDRAGNAEDPSGFQILFRDSLYGLRSGDTLVVRDVAPGSYTARLADVAAHCFTHADTLGLTIRGAVTTTAGFRVECYGDFLYSEWYGQYVDQLFYMDARGVRRKLTPAQDGGQWGATWSPDGSSVAFVKTTPGDQDVYVVDLHGTMRALAAIPGEGESDLDWSPDGRWIAYGLRDSAAGAFTRSNLHLVRPDGSEDRVVLPGERLDLGPVWSPDGAWLAFACWRPQQTICLVHPDGTGLTVAPVTLSLPQHLQWSPDGSRLSFESFVGGRQAVQILRLADWSVVNTTPDRVGYGISRWSPDGAALVVSTGDAGNWGLEVHDADGGGRRVLTNALRWGASWSPDGGRILFGASAASAVDLASPDGGDPHSLVMGGQTVLNAFWRPAPKPGGPAPTRAPTILGPLPARRPEVASIASSACRYVALEGGRAGYRALCAGR